MELQTTKAGGVIQTRKKALGGGKLTQLCSAYKSKKALLGISEAGLFLFTPKLPEFSRLIPLWLTSYIKLA